MHQHFCYTSELYVYAFPYLRVKYLCFFMWVILMAYLLMGSLQVYLSLYTTIRSMVDQVTTGTIVFGDSLSIAGFKVSFSYRALLLGEEGNREKQREWRERRNSEFLIQFKSSPRKVYNQEFIKETNSTFAQNKKEIAIKTMPNLKQIYKRNISYYLFPSIWDELCSSVLLVLLIILKFHFLTPLFMQISGNRIKCMTLCLLHLQIALTYIEASITGKLTAPRGEIVQPVFVGSLKKQLEELLNCSQELKDDFHKYLKSGKWPDGESQEKRSIHLSWFLQWFGVPPSSVVQTAIDRVKTKFMPSSVPLLRLIFPNTPINVISEIDRCFSCS